MIATTPLLFVSIVATGYAPQSAAQAQLPRLDSRVPVDVSVEGSGRATPRAPGDTVRGGNTGLSARRLPLDCVTSLIDQATGECLTASSTASLGMLYPYPGLDNTFVPRAFVGGGEDNRATGPWATIGGGKGNVAAYGYAYGGGQGYTTVGGGTGNEATGNASTVAGGGGNSASGDFCTVGGGAGNTAAGTGSPPAGIATVGGGAGNTAARWGATIGGGYANRAGSFAFVGGGAGNRADGDFSTVGGGYNNDVSGSRATVPGGSSCAAYGSFGFAAGRRAKAHHAGSFVWGDSVGADKPSSAPDQFNVYASGGVRMFTNGAATTGAALAPGSGTWSMLSDRDAKENVEPVDVQAVLEGVVAMPLSTWNYREQSDFVRHMGPMAQDFHASFGLGVSDELIDAVDPDGVALAAIQGLHELMKAKDAEVEELREANEELRGRVERLEALARAALAK